MESTTPEGAENPPSPDRPAGGPDPDNQPPSPPPESDPKQDVDDGGDGSSAEGGDEQYGGDPDADPPRGAESV